jgi:hypothetical protein
VRGIFFDSYGDPTITTIFCGIALFAVSIASILWVATADGRAREARLMAECMQDHKENECVSLMRRPQSHVTPVPVIIPIR